MKESNKDVREERKEIQSRTTAPDCTRRRDEAHGERVQQSVWRERGRRDAPGILLSALRVVDLVEHKTHDFQGAADSLSCLEDFVLHDLVVRLRLVEACYPCLHPRLHVIERRCRPGSATVRRLNPFPQRRWRQHGCRHEKGDLSKHDYGQLHCPATLAGQLFAE
jgi:hypothetical protein